MFKVESLKYGGVTIETDCSVEVVTQNNERVSFIYLSETDYNELMDRMIERGIRKSLEKSK